MCVCVCVCVRVCMRVCVRVCVSGVEVTEIINYNSIYFGFRPLNYTFKTTFNVINTDSNKQLYALVVVAIIINYHSSIAQKIISERAKRASSVMFVFN